MTITQVFQESIRTSMFGMGLVLVTLYILSVILDLMKVVFAPSQKRSSIMVIKDQTIEQRTNRVKAINNIQENIQLTAVITAAISEYTERPMKQIQINTIRKIYKKTPIWAMASRMHNINRHRITSK